MLLFVFSFIFFLLFSFFLWAHALLSYPEIYISCTSFNELSCEFGPVSLRNFPFIIYCVRVEIFSRMTIDAVGRMRRRFEKLTTGIMMLCPAAFFSCICLLQLFFSSLIMYNHGQLSTLLEKLLKTENIEMKGAFLYINDLKNIVLHVLLHLVFLVPSKYNFFKHIFSLKSAECWASW